MSSTTAPVATDTPDAEPEEEKEHNKCQYTSEAGIREHHETTEYEQNGDWTSNDATILLAALLKHGREELSSGNPGVSFVHLAVLAFNHQEAGPSSTGPRDLGIVHHFKQPAGTRVKIQ